MKEKVSLLCIIALVLTVFFTLSACTGTYYTEEEEQKILQEGEAMLRPYLDSLPCEITAESYSMMTGYEEGTFVYAGYYLSHVVKCEFNSDQGAYDAYVFLEDGSIWTDYSMFDLNEAIKKQLAPYCERYGFTGDYTVSSANVSYVITSHDIAKKNSTINTLVDITNVLPAEFDQENAEERAEAFLKDAPISYFTISYVTEDGSFMDPRILTDYLRETGNYWTENVGGNSYWRYEMNGRRPEDAEVSEDCLGYYEMYLEQTEDPSDMTFNLVKVDEHRENGIIFRYTKAEKSGKVSEIEDISWVEYDFPLLVENGKIIYAGGSGNHAVALRFEEKPVYTEILRTTHRDGKAETKELGLVQDENGGWTLKDNTSTYKETWYIFREVQEIEFR